MVTSGGLTFPVCFLIRHRPYRCFYFLHDLGFFLPKYERPSASEGLTALSLVKSCVLRS